MGERKTRAFIPAVHSSSVNKKDLGLGEDDENHWAGGPSGFLISIKDGPSIYHTGDTDLFNDMSLVKKFGTVDYMLVCIGDHFTMGPERAAESVKLVNPSHAIPMHYASFMPLMTGTPEKFLSELKSHGLQKKFLQMNVEESINLKHGS